MTGLRDGAFGPARGPIVARILTPLSARRKRMTDIKPRRIAVANALPVSRLDGGMVYKYPHALQTSCYAARDGMEVCLCI